MKTFEVNVTNKYNFTEENINDLMCSALEGGINYWCDKVKMIGTIEGVDIASDFIAKDGKLKIYFDGESDVLTLEKFLDGINNTIKNLGTNFTDAEDFMNNHDADTADMIIQFALFNEIVYA